jgi:hypothetical protein
MPELDLATVTAADGRDLLAGRRGGLAAAGTALPRLECRSGRAWWR